VKGAPENLEQVRPRDGGGIGGCLKPPIKLAVDKGLTRSPGFSLNNQTCAGIIICERRKTMNIVGARGEKRETRLRGRYSAGLNHLGRELKQREEYPRRHGHRKQAINGKKKTYLRLQEAEMKKSEIMICRGALFVTKNKGKDHF